MKNVLTMVILLLALTVRAQQDPIYAQYLNNPLVINPAYAGNNLMLNAGVQYRSQWAGIDAHPSTFAFAAHSSVLNNKMGVGATLVQDKIGETVSTEFNAVFSYMIAFKKSRLSFGMQTGFTRYTSDPDKLSIRDNGDPSFRFLRATTFNVGSGVMWSGDQYTISLSAPRMLPVSVSQDGATIKLYDQSYYLYGAYAFVLSEKFKIRPSVLLRTTKGVPLSADLNAGLIVQQNYAIGLLTRNFNTYGMQFLAAINDLKLGYVIEVPSGKESNLNFTSHEFMIAMSVGVIRYHNKVTHLY